MLTLNNIPGYLEVPCAGSTQYAGAMVILQYGVILRLSIGLL